MNDTPCRHDESDGRTAVRSVLNGRPELHSNADWDSVIGALSKRRRRYLLYFLAEEPAAPIEGLADGILALEAEVIDGVDRDRSDVLISLRHRDLPVMEDAKLVAFDEDAGVVARGGCFSVAIDLLDGAFRPSSDAEG